MSFDLYTKQLKLTDEHKYLWLGKPTVSVTQVLSSVGAIDMSGSWHSIAGTEDYEKYAKDRAKSVIGRELHALASYLVHGIDAKYDEALEPWAKHLKVFIWNEIGTLIPNYSDMIKITEEPIYNRQLGYAQTPDLVTYLHVTPNERLKNTIRVRHVHVLDWKFTSTHTQKESWWLQTAAYAHTIRQVFGMQAWPTTHIVNITPQGAVHEEHNPILVRSDFSKFLSAYNIYKLINKQTHTKEEQHAEPELADTSRCSQ